MKVKKFVLSNGLRVVLAPRAEALAASVLVLVEAGSKYETKEINGLSHFLEHLCFKGTKRYPGPMAVSAALDNLGASYNAFTAQEFTGYYATVEPRRATEALDLVADLYLHPALPAAEIDRERGVVIEEINMYEDMPRRQVQELVWKLLYGEQAAGQTVLGPKENIRKLTREQIIAYRAAHYVAPATTVVVAGRFAAAQMLRLVKKHFGVLPPAPKRKLAAVREDQKRPAVLLKHKASDQTHLVLALRGRALGHRDEVALGVLAAVLGGSMSSRLWRRIREELGAAYYVGAAHEAYLGHGFFTIFVGADTTRVNQIIKVILEECAGLKKQMVPAAELQRTKSGLIGRLYLGLETASDLGQFYGFQELLQRRIKEPAELVREIEAVTPSKLRRLANEIFRNDQLNLALIGPFKDGKVFLDTLRLP